MFEKLNLRFLKNKFDKKKDVSKEQTAEFDLPLINAKDGNNGIMYYGRSSNFESTEMTIDIVKDGAISTGNVYPQPQKTGVLYNAYLVKPLFSVTQRLLYFFSTTIQKSIKLKFGYENKAGWEKVKKEKISLPTHNGAIDFAFMETFIAELEAQCIAELEAYLTVTGLKNYNLTKEEEETLNSLDKVRWKEYKIVDIFNVKNTNSILSTRITPNSGKIPYLSASQSDNSVASYIEYNRDMIDKGNSIFIGGKTLVISYQEQDYFSNDSHNLALYIKDGKAVEKKKQLFMVACLYKSLKHLYTWGNSISNKKIQKDIVMLPTKNDTPDYDFMNTYISAIYKVVIREVVLYAKKKIQATQEAIK